MPGPIDPYPQNGDTVMAESRLAVAVTTHDTNPLPSVAKRLYVGTGGDVALRTVDGAADVVYKSVVAGSYLSVRAAYVRAALTTASNIIAEL